MNNQLTELVFILDRSGSMHGLEKDTLGGFNSMMEKQKKGEGNALVTTVLFDTKIDVIHDRLPLKSVRPMTEEDYVAGGCTALLDAVGSTIHRIGTVHKYARPEDVSAHTLVVIITDGAEFLCDEEGIQKNFEAVDDFCDHFVEQISVDWKKGIEEDFKRRGRK